MAVFQLGELQPSLMLLTTPVKKAYTKGVR